VNATLRAAYGSDRLEFVNGRVDDDGYFTCGVAVVIDDSEWEPIELQMIPPYRSDMVAFFEEIAAGASQGWDGEKRWESEFSQLHLTALSDGSGKVTVRVFARWKPDYERERRGVLEVTAEAAEHFGERMRTFLRMSDGRRLGSRSGLA
jgi:hypothetical protein